MFQTTNQNNFFFGALPIKAAPTPMKGKMAHITRARSQPLNAARKTLVVRQVEKLPHESDPWFIQPRLVPSGKLT